MHTPLLASQVNLPQLIGALGGAKNAFGVEEIGTNIAINAGVVAVCLLLNGVGKQKHTQA
jgi:hypothetical protein